MYNSLFDKKFVKCTGKIRAEKTHKTWDETEQWRNKGGQLGLIIPAGLIVVDIDTEEDSKKMLRTVEHAKLKCGIHKTPKGYHFIFKDSQAGRKQVVKRNNALGIMIDTRTAGDNYIVLPINDTKREVIREFNDDCQEVPKYLLPTKNAKKVEIEKGSRNDNLQRHAWSLRSQGFTKEEVREIILLINEVLLDEPLPVTELANTVLRDANLDLVQPMKKFQHNIFADDLLAKLNLITVNDIIYNYEVGVYKPFDLHYSLIGIDSSLKKAQRNEVEDYIRVVTRSSRQQLKMANTRNGLYDRKGNFFEHKPQFLTTFQCNFFYDENAYDDKMAQFLIDISDNDEEMKKGILEMLGYCMFDDVKEQVMFILYGPSASNGKSTLTQIARKLIRNTSSVSLHEVAKGGFMLPNLEGSLLNIVTELQSEYLSDMSIVKAVVGGDTITIDKKYSTPYEMTNLAKFVISTNELPATKIDRGVARRMRIFEFTKQFDVDTDFEVEDLMHQEALNYLGTQALKAYVEKCKRGKWSYEEKNENLVKMFIESSDSVEQFLAITHINDMQVVVELYNSYRLFCIDAGLSPKSSHKFRSRLAQDYKIVKKTIDNVTADRIDKEE